MTLRKFLEVLAVSMPFTVGTIGGQGWVVYYDGEHKIEIPDALADREITNIYPREGRERTVVRGVETCCELKAGLGIVIEGCENGNI